jgi:alkylation response protein AidB-like acyl-CoA dehydrogenase
MVQFPNVSAPGAWQALAPSSWLDSPGLAGVAAALARQDVIAEIEGAEEEARYPEALVQRLLQAGGAQLLSESLRPQDGTSYCALSALNALTAQTSGSIAIILGVNALALLPVAIAGSPEQLGLVEQRLATGQLISMLLTEADHGSDLMASETRAEPGVLDAGEFRPCEPQAASHYRLTGAKHYINNARHASLLTVLAQTSKPTSGALSAATGLSVFLCDADGVEVLPRYRTLPMGAAHISGARFQECAVPAERLLGREGGGLGLIQRALNISRGAISSLASGTSHRATRIALEWTRSRVLYGRPIAHLDVIAEHALRMAALDLSVAALSVKASAMSNALGQAAAYYAHAAKYACCVLAERAVEEGRQILSGHALIAGRYERVVRDVLLYGVFDGTRHVVLHQIVPRMAQMAAAARGEVSDPRIPYATAPAALIDVVRKKGRPRVERIDDRARVLAAMDSAIDLEPAEKLFSTLLELCGALNSDGSRDSAVSFVLAECLSLAEAMLAVAELGDPARRRALGLSAALPSAAGLGGQELCRYALGEIGAELAARVQLIAARAGKDAKHLTSVQSAFLALSGGARAPLKDALRQPAS